MAKIPSKAKRVFRGNIFDVYQWKQKLYDGTSATFEMLKRPNTVLVIATHKGKIVVVEEEQPRKKKTTNIVGGRQDKGETPLQAAKRELLEETGLISDSWELFKTYEPTSKIEWDVYVFIARDCEKKAEQKLDAGEKIVVHSISFDAFIRLVLSKQFTDKELQADVFRAVIEKKVKKLREKIFKK